MSFDPTTAIPVIERPDGLLEKDNFNPSTARPVSDSIPQLRNNPNAKYQPPLTDQDRARALVELSYREKGENLPLGLKIDWALTSDKARAVTAAGANTLLTGGLYPVVQGLRGIADNEKDYSLMDAATKGILYPSETKRLTDPLMAKDAPQWAKTTQSISEDILSYGVGGIAKGMAETKLVVRDLARRLDKAATQFAEDKVGFVTAEKGVIDTKQADLAKKIDEVKSGYIDDVLLRMSATDTSTMKTGFQEFAESRSMIKMLADEMNAGGVSVGLSIKPVVGQTVSFSSAEGKTLVGKISEIAGNRATIDMEGRDIIATLSQLTIPKIADDNQKMLEFKPKIQGEGFITYTQKQSKEMMQMIESLPETISKKEADKAFKNAEDLLNKNISSANIKDIVREQTGQNFASKVLLQSLKEKYADQIKAGKLENEIEQKLAQPLATSETKKVIRESTGQIKDQGGVVSQRTAFIQSLRDQIKAAKQSKSFTKEEIFDTQKSLTDLIDNSELEPSDKSKFLRTIKNVQSSEDLAQLMKGKIAQTGKRAGEIIEKPLGDKINELIDKMERRNLASDIKGVDTEGIAVEYKQAIENIQSQFDLKSRSDKTLKKREKIREFIDRMKSEGRDISIPDNIIAMIDKPTLNNVDIEKLREIKSTVEHLARIGKTKLRARESIYQSKKENITAKLLDDVYSINSKKLPNVPLGENKNDWAQRAIDLQNYATKTKVGLTPIEGLADITGMQAMKKDLDNKFGNFLSFNDVNLKKWHELTKNLEQSSLKRIGAYAANQQEGGLERLINSGYDKKEIESIELSPEEMKAYEFARETFDKYFPEVERYAKEVYNEGVGKIDNYVSFMSDFEAMSDLEMYDRFGQRPQEAIGRKTKTVEQGFRKERAAVSKIKLETNIDKIFRRHLDDVAYMLTMGKDIKMYSEIVNSSEMTEALGDVGALAWKQWLDLMARKGGVDSAKKIAAIDVIRRNVGLGVLGFRLSSALVQLSSFGDTMATMGSEYSMRGAKNIATSKEWRNFIMDNFPEVKKAVGDDIAFRELGEGYLEVIARIGMTPLQFMDGMMRSTAASAAYEKVAAERGIEVDLKNPDKEIVQEATKLMRQSQGSSFFKDQPLAITAGYGLTENQSLNKTLLQFQSFMLGRWDNINRQIWRLGIKERNYKKASMSLLWLIIFGLGGSVAMRRVSKAIMGTKTKKKEDPTFTEDMANEALGVIPLVGSLASSIAYSSNPVPIIKTFEDGLSGANSMMNGENNSTKLKGALRTAGSAGSLVGIPGITSVAQVGINMIKSKSRKIRD